MHKDKPFYELVVASIAGQPVVSAVYMGEDVIAKLRRACGSDPATAPKWTIRGKYGTDSLEVAIREGRVCDTVVHCSDCPEEARREIPIWEKYLKVLEAYPGR